MAAKTCEQCNHRGTDVEGGRCFFCVRGVEIKESILGHALLEALGKRAPMANAKEKAANKAEGRARVYTAKAEDVGAKTTREVFDLLTKSTKFDEARTKAADFTLLMSALAVVRCGSFQAEPPFTYVASDAIHVRSLLSANYTPAQIARAFVAASRTDYYRNRKGINFSELPKAMPSLLASAQSSTGAGKERRAELMASITAAIARLDDCDPITAIEYSDIDRSRMDVGSLADMESRISADLKKHDQGLKA